MVLLHHQQQGSKSSQDHPQIWVHPAPGITVVFTFQHLEFIRNMSEKNEGWTHAKSQSDGRARQRTDQNLSSTLSSVPLASLTRSSIMDRRIGVPLQREELTTISDKCFTQSHSGPLVPLTLTPFGPKIMRRLFIGQSHSGPTLRMHPYSFDSASMTSNYRRWSVKLWERKVK